VLRRRAPPQGAVRRRLLTAAARRPTEHALVDLQPVCTERGPVIVAKARPSRSSALRRYALATAAVRLSHQAAHSASRSAPQAPHCQSQHQRPCRAGRDEGKEHDRCVRLVVPSRQSRRLSTSQYEAPRPWLRASLAQMRIARASALSISAIAQRGLVITFPRVPPL
jgi:hypothetical protein